MKTLKERGYQYPLNLGYDREAYRLRAAYMLENNDLLPAVAQSTTVEVLKTLYGEEFGLEVEYKDGLLERLNAYGAAASIEGTGPQIYLDKSLLDGSTPTLRKLHLSTLAHELGHAFLHYEEIRMRAAALTDKESAFMKKEVCPHAYWLTYLQEREGRKRPLSQSEFTEYQANQIMVGLLMPFSTLYNQAAQIIKFKLECLHHEYGWERDYAILARPHEVFDFAVNQISDCYQVSKQMAAFELYRIMGNKDLSRIFQGITPADPIEKRPVQRCKEYGYIN